jgi:hypothetical protein
MPTLETAAGGISIAEHLLAQTIANCTQFQVDCGATGDATTTLTHIYFDSLPLSDDGDSFTREELIEKRPYCIVATNPENGYSWGRIAAESWDDSGSLLLIFEYNTPDYLSGDNQALFRWFKNRLGNIMRPDPDVFSGYVGLSDLAHQGAYHASTRARMGLMGRADQLVFETEGDYMLGTMIVDWGVQE